MDREQMSRDASAVLASATASGKQLARHCLALLAELEQAERDSERAANESRDLSSCLRQCECERDEARFDSKCALPEAAAHIALLEARLAKVPALVEALEECWEALDRTPTIDGAAFIAWGNAKEVLNDWESD